jgi:ubiquinone/menaquinone biosynthesis C-methylase UbiE
LYNELAWAYDPVSWLVSLGRWDTLRKAVLDYQTGVQVLEIGFGTGELLLELRRRNISAVGLDRSAAMQHQTRKKMRQSSLWVPCVQADTRHMPFANRSFDTILSTFPAGYIFEAGTWSEVGRLLHKPGRFVIVGIGTSKADTPPPRLLRILFGPPMEPLVARFESLAGEAGLNLRLVPYSQGRLAIPILIAEAGHDQTRL